MKLNTVFKASWTLSAEQENTYTCNCTIRFHLHLCSVRNSLVHKNRKIRMKGSADLQYFSSSLSSYMAMCYLSLFCPFKTSILLIYYLVVALSKHILCQQFTLKHQNKHYLAPWLWYNLCTRLQFQVKKVSLRKR